MPDLEQQLTTLGTALEWPPTPQLHLPAMRGGRPVRAGWGDTIAKPSRPAGAPPAPRPAPSPPPGLLPFPPAPPPTPAWAPGPHYSRQAPPWPPPLPPPPAP